jgi:hypothetical protein
MRKFAEWCVALACVLTVLWIANDFCWHPYDGASFPVPIRVQDIAFVAVSAVIGTAWSRFLPKSVMWWGISLASVAFALGCLPHF